VAEQCEIDLRRCGPLADLRSIGRVTQDVARSGSTDRRAENAHVIATCDLTGFFRREAAR
jgi:hypothetical protein